MWVHGWLLAQGERMSKSRGNFLDPLDFVAAFGADGARYVALREAAFDRDSDVSWDGFIRRYNADLANDFGNLVNRTVSMAGRYLGGERPVPRPAAESALAGRWAATRDLVVERLDGCLLHEALASLWEFVGAANRLVDTEAPWNLAKAAKAGDEAAAGRLRDGSVFLPIRVKEENKYCGEPCSRRYGIETTRRRKRFPLQRREVRQLQKQERKSEQT